MMFGFFGTDHSRLHEAFHIRVIARHPRNPAVADEVEPRVPDVHVIEFVITISATASTLAAPIRAPQRVTYDCRRRAGCSHTPQFRMGKAVLPDPLVSALQGLDQCLLRVVAGKIKIGRQQRFPRRATRYLEPYTADNAIRHNRHSPLAEEQLVILRLPIAEGILVIAAHASDVGLARYFNSGADLHPDTISIAGMAGIGKWKTIMGKRGGFIRIRALRSNRGGTLVGFDRGDGLCNETRTAIRQPSSGVNEIEYRVISLPAADHILPSGWWY